MFGEVGWCGLYILLWSTSSFSCWLRTGHHILWRLVSSQVMRWTMLTSKHWLIRQESALSKVFSLHTVKSTYLPDLDFLTSKISEHHLETSSTQVKTLILYVVEFLKKKKKSIIRNTCHNVFRKKTFNPILNLTVYS